MFDAESGLVLGRGDGRRVDFYMTVSSSPRSPDEKQRKASHGVDSIMEVLLHHHRESSTVVKTCDIQVQKRHVILVVPVAYQSTERFTLPLPHHQQTSLMARILYPLHR